MSDHCCFNGDSANILRHNEKAPPVKYEYTPLLGLISEIVV